MKELARQIFNAVQKGILREPFNAAMLNVAVPGWAEKTYHAFLDKHSVGNGYTTEIFVRVSRGFYRLNKVL
jgi:hypothetical protein